MHAWLESFIPFLGNCEAILGPGSSSKEGINLSKGREHSPGTVEWFTVCTLTVCTLTWDSWMVYCLYPYSSSCASLWCITFLVCLSMVYYLTWDSWMVYCLYPYCLHPYLGQLNGLLFAPLQFLMCLSMVYFLTEVAGQVGHLYILPLCCSLKKMN